MYYHVIIETTEKIGKTSKNRKIVEYDATDLTEITRRVVAPYVQGEQIHFDGYFLQKEEIARISIKESSEPVDHLVQRAYSKLGPNVFIVLQPSEIVQNSTYAKDITQKLFDEAKQSEPIKASMAKPTSSTRGSSKKEVFIVHGHDDHAKIETARFIESLKYKAIILHEQASSGMTIIEKIEANSDVAFAVVLYTPCDLGRSAKVVEEQKRARQNVVFEHGFLIGRLGRSKVCALVKGDIETPNDISGVVYISIDTEGAWKFKLAKEMRAAGCKIDLNDL